MFVFICCIFSFQMTVHSSGHCLGFYSVVIVICHKGVMGFSDLFVSLHLCVCVLLAGCVCVCVCGTSFVRVHLCVGVCPHGARGNFPPRPSSVLWPCGVFSFLPADTHTHCTSHIHTHTHTQLKVSRSSQYTLFPDCPSPRWTQRPLTAVMRMERLMNASGLSESAAWLLSGMDRLVLITHQKKKKKKRMMMMRRRSLAAAVHLIIIIIFCASSLHLFFCLSLIIKAQLNWFYCLCPHGNRKSPQRL